MLLSLNPRDEFRSPLPLSRALLPSPPLHPALLFSVLSYERSDGRNGRFLTSNTNITVEEDGNVIDVPIADRFAKFETKQYV